MTAIRILIADDHTLVRAGLRALLRNLDGIEVVAEANDGHEAIKLVESAQPDIVLMDITMPRLNGLEATSRLIKLHPSLGIIILSMHGNEEYVRETLRAGARGYMLKGSDPVELAVAINAVYRGDTYLSPAVSTRLVTDFLDRRDKPPRLLHELTPRQREVLQLVAEGHSTKDIAHLLDLSVKTIETHRAQLMERLDLHDVPSLVKYAIRAGLVTAEQ